MKISLKHDLHVNHHLQLYLLTFKLLFSPGHPSPLSATLGYTSTSPIGATRPNCGPWKKNLFPLTWITYMYAKTRKSKLLKVSHKYYVIQDMLTCTNRASSFPSLNSGGLPTTVTFGDGSRAVICPNFPSNSRPLIPTT